MKLIMSLIKKRSISFLNEKSPTVVSEECIYL